MTNVLAIDIGASSGRAIIGRFDGETIKMAEINRFANGPVEVRGVLYWDILRLYDEIIKSIEIAARDFDIESVAIDTWAVDFGLLDNNGRLMENPVHYRDKRTDKVIKKALEIFPSKILYEYSGNQIMQINTLFQLYAIKEQNPELLKNAETLLMIPDLFNYFLTGKKYAELSNASTTQMLNPFSKDWCDEIISAFDLPKKILPPVIDGGKIIGNYRCGNKEIKITSVCSHDTQSAAVAVPALGDNDFLFISSGTWSLFGTELNAPVINEKSQELNITNELGYDGKVSLLKNLTGMWLIQECKREWEKAGKNLSFSELEKLASSSEPFKAFINTEDIRFASSGDIPGKICAFCKETRQYAPFSIGETIRTINEGLAFQYRTAAEKIAACTGKTYDKLYIVGGGVKSSLMCQMTANALGIPIFAGTSEAAALGNIAVQHIALGKIKDTENARRIIKKSVPMKTYIPENKSEWDNRYKEYLSVITK